MEVFCNSFLQPFVLDVSFVLCQSELRLSATAAKVLLGWSFGAPQQIQISTLGLAIDGSFDHNLLSGVEEFDRSDGFVWSRGDEGAAWAAIPVQPFIASCHSIFCFVGCSSGVYFPDGR